MINYTWPVYDNNAVMYQYMGNLILSPDVIAGKHITVSHGSAYTHR